MTDSGGAIHEARAPADDRVQSSWTVGDVAERFGVEEPRPASTELFRRTR